MCTPYTWLWLTLLFALAGSGQAQPARPTVVYDLVPQTPNSHLITVTLRYAPRNRSNISMWPFRPGVRDGIRFKTTHGTSVISGPPTRPGGRCHGKKTDKSTWRIQCGAAREVRVSYACYANTLDAGSTLWNDEELYWNGTNLLMYVVGKKTFWRACR